MQFIHTASFNQIRLILCQIWMRPYLYIPLTVDKDHLLYYIEIAQSLIQHLKTFQSCTSQVQLVR